MSGNVIQTTPTVATPPNPYIRADIGSLASFLQTQLGLTASVSSISSILQTYITTYGNNPIPLTQLNPDFEANKNELGSILLGSSAWTDIVTAGIGQTVSEMFAAMATYNQMGLEKGVQEAVLGTAVLDSSIYEISRMQGVHVQRMIPGFLPATLTIPVAQQNSLSIAAYTQFVINGVNYFNRDVITFPAGSTSVSAVLYQGTVSTINFTATGGGFQIYEFGNSDFAISDIDVMVSVNGVAYSDTVINEYLSQGLWEFSSGDTVYKQDTNSIGNVEILFGDGNYGVAPAAGDVIEVTFVTTLGAAGNLNTTGLSISCPSNSLISGTATGITQNGSNQKNALDYKFLTPALIAANFRAVTTNDYKALAVTYPGVIDALFLGQADFAPTNLQYMMNVQAYLYTNQAWTSTQWQNFISWIQNLGVANIVVLQETLSTVSIDISANIYCFAQSNLNSIENTAYSNLIAAFAPRVGIINYSRYLSDIDKIISGSSKQIDYIDIVSPTADTVLSNSAVSVIQLGTVSLNMQYSTRPQL